MAKVWASRSGGGRNIRRVQGASRRRISGGIEAGPLHHHLEMDVLLGEAPDALDLVEHRVDQRRAAAADVEDEDQLARLGDGGRQRSSASKGTCRARRARRNWVAVHEGGLGEVHAGPISRKSARRLAQSRQ